MLLLYIMLWINNNFILVGQFGSTLYICNYCKIAVLLHNVTNNVCSCSYPISHKNSKHVLKRHDITLNGKQLFREATGKFSLPFVNDFK